MVLMCGILFENVCVKIIGIFFTPNPGLPHAISLTDSQIMIEARSPHYIQSGIVSLMRKLTTIKIQRNNAHIPI